jgi:hypothetical protein
VQSTTIRTQPNKLAVYDLFEPAVKKKKAGDGNNQNNTRLKSFSWLHMLLKLQFTIIVLNPKIL